MFDEKVLKTLLKNTPIGYAYLKSLINESESVFVISEVNPAFTKITGISNENKGKTLIELEDDENDLIGEILSLAGSVVSTGEARTLSKCFKSTAKCLYIYGFLVDTDSAIIQVLDKTEEELLKNVLTKRAEELQYLSYHDKLTGLYNRAFFEVEMKRLDTDRNLPISIIMGDTNSLKLINDVFGHAAGDEMIKSTANILTKTCRQDDIIARWGGDEFIVLLPKTSSNDAMEIISRIKSKFSDDRFDFDYLNISLGYAVKEDKTIPISEIVKKAEDDMYKNKSVEGKQVRKLIVSSIINHLYEGNIEVKNHMDRLKRYTREIAIILGLPEEDLEKLNILCEVHDIGNVSIDKNILFKTDPLTDLEWDEIKKHPEIGYRIAKSIPELTNIANYILYHHEKWDGTGYPHQLKGQDIPLLSRIFSVVDTFDALTQNKTYRKAYSNEYALKYIKDNAGKLFDPDIGNILVNKVNLS